MLLAAACDDGQDALGPQLGGFLDGPLHAIEFEDGEQQRDGQSGISLDFGDQVEADLESPVIPAMTPCHTRPPATTSNSIPGCARSTRMRCAA